MLDRFGDDRVNGELAFLGSHLRRVLVFWCLAEEDRSAKGRMLVRNLREVRDQVKEAEFSMLPMRYTLWVVALCQESNRRRIENSKNCSEI